MPPKLGSSRHSVPPYIVLTAVIVAAMLIIVPVMFLQVRSVERSENLTVPMEDGMTDIRLRVLASLGMVEVGFAELDGEAVKVAAFVNGTSGLFGNDDPLKANVTYEIDPASGSMNVTVRFDVYAPRPYYSLDDARCNVLIDKSLAADINITVATGGAVVRTTEGSVITGLRIDATSLGSVVALNNGTVLSGDVRIRTATGGNSFYWNNLTVNGSRLIEVEESSGEMLLRLSQAGGMGGSVTIHGLDHGGLISADLRLSGDVSASLAATSSLREVELNCSDGFRHQDGGLASNNHPAASSFDIRLNSTMGSIEARCRWTP